MNYPVVCFGEILWDILPTTVVPGGAPMNVAYHLRKLGINPALITRVGPDNYGKRLIQLMEKQGITTDYFQMDFELDTGKVTMAQGEGEDIHYDIVKPVAWDNIEWDEQFVPLVSQCSYLVFGSLSTRSEASREVIYALRDLAKYRVLDINLRPPHYNRQILEHLLDGTELLKLNIGELELLTGWFSGHRSERDRINTLQDRFHIPTIVVTKGSRGSVISVDGEFYEHPGFRVDLADTVGSGDAFLAGLLFQLSRKAPPEKALEFASAMGALIASYSGPCPEYKVEEVNTLIAQ
ncbi:carbohydrate kinase family protein [Puia sp. P3]|uniref:carbohydrate kinase family protein n=1 Tax=Puia sp. P3 TaxID=3423952 RepID=UPI003D67CA58